MPRLPIAVVLLALLAPVRPATAQWIEDHPALHVFSGEEAGEQFGYEAADAGDLDGDGARDVIVGAPEFDGQRGRIDLFSGRTGERLGRVTGEPGERFGWSVAGAGDVDADGRDDVVIGAPGAAGGTGRVVVLSGRDHSVLLALEGAAPGDAFGDEVETAGDVDGDGHDDLVVGATGADDGTGRVSVHSGADGHALYVLHGERPGDRFGASVAGAVRGEVKLLVVGAPDAGEGQRGQARVFAGDTGEPLFTLDADPTGVDLGSHFVSIVGDVDADGSPDVYASDWKDGSAGPDTGRVYVASGRDGRRLLTLSGAGAGAGFGCGNARAGDADGDGHDDLLVGSWLSAVGARGGGRVELISGKDGTTLAAWSGDVPGDALGFDATGLGDVDGDGRPELLVSAAYHGEPGPKTGRVFVLAGVEPAPVIGLPQAQAMLQGKDFEGAAAALAALTERQPGNAAAWYLRGFALHTLGDYQAAVAVDAKAASFPAVHAGALYNLACAQSCTGDLDGALQSLTAAFAAGFSNVKLVRADAELAALREDPRLEELLAHPPEPADGFLEPTRVIHVFTGEATGDQFGWVARDAGDVDGDGAHDAVVSAPYHGANAGRAYVYSGRTGELLWTRDGDPGEQLGIAVATAGDVDGDGLADVILGAPQPGTGPGAAYVCRGTDGELLLTLRGEAAGDRFGNCVLGPGDLDGDGTTDLIVAAPFHGAGRVTLFAADDGHPLLSLDGARAGDQFGNTVAALVDGPRRLLAVSAINAGPRQQGEVSVWSGWPPQQAFTTEADATGVNYSRFFLSFVGDVDADGTPDLYSVDFENGALAPGTGRFYVHSGRDGHLLHVRTGLPGEGLGIGPAVCGDVDGDGHDDLVVGAWTNSEGAPNGGKTYLISGADFSVLRTWTATGAGIDFGFDAVGLGDVDGDGAVDFLVTAANHPANGPRTGRTWVLAGQPREPAPSGASED